MKTKDKYPPAVYFIIVHWKNFDDTIECLLSLFDVDYSNFKVILLNNGSSDFNKEYVQIAFPDVLILTSKKNLGFSAGNNLGITRALEDGADLVLLLNNDTVISKDLILALLPAINEPDVGIVGPTISYYENTARIWAAGGGYSRVIGCSYRIRPLAPFYGNRDVDWISGCALLAKREVFEKVGLFWEPFYLNYEEVDFCLRAAKANYRCIQVGKPLVRHKISASHGIRGTDDFSPDKAYYFARNQILLLRRNSSGMYALTGFLSQFIIALPFWTFQCILARNITVLRHYFIGILDGILGRSGKRPS